jgi:hypothetical protein
MLRSNLLVALFILTVPGAGSALAQTSQSSGGTYQWFGELVAVDRPANSITVKSRVAYPEAVTELQHFKPSEPVWVVWSGVLDYTDAVRQFRHADADRPVDENLVLPAELVTPQASNQYVTLRVKVPADSLAAIEAVQPGQWVTVTSRHRPKTADEAVVAVTAYGGNTNTTAETN